MRWHQITTRDTTVAPKKRTKKTTTPRPGRPPTGRLATELLRVRVTAEERTQLQTAADEQGLTLHAYCRSCLGLNYREA